ncbi:MAG: permease [Scytonema sp. PMC 1069.18]|nr:permease [Scytonema sp. PMC 1069.18]MEC4882590.1 permease [Scytonema sp. PMC 1070.18]
MNDGSFWQLYSEAVLTSLSFFWKALWAFVLGYVVSSAIQVFVTRERMQHLMGQAGSKSVALGTFFGFISSSCSFAALATTRSLFVKGAGFVPSLAFLLASTNLVIELGIIIAIFLGWQFVAAEYIGGVLLIGFMWLIVSLTKPKKLVRKKRQQLRENEGGDRNNQDVPDWKERIRSIKGWQQVARQYFMEWGMVWKDVTIGFTIAGIIAVFVPPAFFNFLFIGSGENPSFLALLENVLVGPAAAFVTFIGSMGNIPLAAVLYNNGVSFAGIIAFIFSDLVVLPVVRVNAKYYGWKIALYIVGVFLAAIVATALLIHYGFALLGLLPQGGSQNVTQTQRFAIDYTFWLNLVFLSITGVLAWLRFGRDRQQKKHHDGGHHQNSSGKQRIFERFLFWITMLCYIWLAGGLIISLFQ